ncbi:hypothetical protein PSCT_04463 [Pseudomonas sp. SCT]|nr:hypothetical protein PSCT_04463 [Pseudomonas sp. SCT]
MSWLYPTDAMGLCGGAALRILIQQGSHILGKFEYMPGGCLALGKGAQPDDLGLQQPSQSGAIDLGAQLAALLRTLKKSAQFMLDGIQQRIDLVLQLRLLVADFEQRLDEHAGPRRRRAGRRACIGGCKPETQKFPSADQHGLSRAWSMSSCIARMTSSWVYVGADGKLTLPIEI